MAGQTFAIVQFPEQAYRAFARRAEKVHICVLTGEEIALDRITLCVSVTLLIGETAPMVAK